MLIWVQTSDLKRGLEICLKRTWFKTGLRKIRMAAELKSGSRKAVERRAEANATS